MSACPWRVLKSPAVSKSDHLNRVIAKKKNEHEFNMELPSLIAAISL
jgi:hypothetical protein